MEANPQPLAPQSPVNDPPLAPVTIPPTTGKPKRSLWIILAAAVGALCLCVAICVAVSAFGLRNIVAEKAPVESVLDAYMKAMAVKDAAGAYALLSPRAQRQIPISKVQELLVGNNYVLFEGYQSLSVVNLNLNAAANTNPDLPQGTVASVSGTISYAGGVQGTFTGTLEKADAKWQIYGVLVTVPPGKFHP